MVHKPYSSSMCRFFAELLNTFLKCALLEFWNELFSDCSLCSAPNAMKPMEATPPPPEASA